MLRRLMRSCIACSLFAFAFGTSPYVYAQSSSSASSTPAPLSARQAPGASQDPVLSLIAESDRHFKAGQKQLDLGHVDAAKQEFNQAVNVLLESAYGARTEPQIREYFDRLVDRISTYEVKALAEGDGFTEKKYESASIDELLALSSTFDHPAPADLKATVKNDLQAGSHDIAIPLNQRVLSYVELFQGRLHDFIEDGLKRGSQYLPMIQNVFRAEGLPLDLAYVPLIESAFKPNALSKASAKGVWQFMKGTALENGLRHDWYIDERSDPEKATVAAAKYLNTLYNLFDDWHLALASYNGGPGRLQRAMKRVGAGDFWALADKPKLLPRETREYVPMILAAIVIARNPAQYGFEAIAPAEPPRDFETITLPRPVDLRRVAEWAGTTIDDIQSLNPELRRWTTPVKDARYELKVPMGSAAEIMTRLDESVSVDLASLKWYTVKRGDTLPLVARKLHVNKSELAEANDLKLTARVAAGQKLIVPQQPAVLMAARTERTVPAAEARSTVAHAGELAQPAATSSRIKAVYEVQKGDTLASIARLFSTSVSAIRTWNPVLGSQQLMAGQRLTVYKPSN